MDLGALLNGFMKVVEALGNSDSWSLGAISICVVLLPVNGLIVLREFFFLPSTLFLNVRLDPPPIIIEIFRASSCLSDGLPSRWFQIWMI